MASNDMMFALTPNAVAGPKTSYATLDILEGGSSPVELWTVLDFDSASIEYADFKIALPANYAGGGLTFTLVYTMSSANSGNVVWEIAFRQCSDGNEEMDSDGSQAYDYNSVTDAVEATVGRVGYAAITFTDGDDMDYLAAGEMAMLRVRRNGSSGNDTASGDAELQMIICKET
jgi:hypothetical protein